VYNCNCDLTGSIKIVLHVVELWHDFYFIYFLDLCFLALIFLCHDYYVRDLITVMHFEYSYISYLSYYFVTASFSLQANKYKHRTPLCNFVNVIHSLCPALCITRSPPWAQRSFKIHAEYIKVNTLK
jgi:hypothetical protein